MAAKEQYKIPTSLDRSYLDHEIIISGGGWQLPALPIKVLLFWTLGLFFAFWAVSNTSIGQANILLIVGWLIIWFILVGVLAKYNKNKELAFKKVPTLLSYLPKSYRHVNTRRSADPYQLYSIIGVESIDDDGLIVFSDGSIGSAYLVVGSASVLVFEEDQKAILNRVDAFFKKIDENVECIFVTTKEPQRVYTQLAGLDDLNNNLFDRDPELFELLEERFDILKNFVGSTFMSIHQYLIIKSDKTHALEATHNFLSNEIEESSLFIKSANMLDKQEVLDLFSVFYKANED